MFMLFIEIYVVHFCLFVCVIQKEVHIARSVSRYFKELSSHKLVLRCHIWDKTKWSFKTDDFLKEVQFV